MAMKYQKIGSDVWLDKLPDGHNMSMGYISLDGGEMYTNPYLEVDVFYSVKSNLIRGPYNSHNKVRLDIDQKGENVLHTLLTKAEAYKLASLLIEQANELP